MDWELVLSEAQPPELNPKRTPERMAARQTVDSDSERQHGDRRSVFVHEYKLQLPLLSTQPVHHGVLATA